MLITGDTGEQSPRTVLVVCTANVCRSPLAQRLVGSGFADAGWLAGVDVVSAGVSAEPNLAMCAVSAAQVPDESGVAFAAAHHSKELTRQMVSSAGIVLTAAKEHRSAIARLTPGSQSKTFTWKEAVMLAEAAEQRILTGGARRPADLSELAHLLHSMRGTIPMAPTATSRGLFRRRTPEPQDPLTVADGHGGSPTEHEAAVIETKRVSEHLVGALGTLIGTGADVRQG